LAVAVPVALQLQVEMLDQRVPTEVIRKSLVVASLRKLHMVAVAVHGQRHLDQAHRAVVAVVAVSNLEAP
jgi:hypothetical protein